MKNPLTFLLNHCSSVFTLSAALFFTPGARAQSDHTIVIDGTNDFYEAENLGTESGRTGYMTWDANNLYLGFAGNPMVNTNSNLYVVVDTDPATMSDPRTSGTGRPDQPTNESGGATYPFTANVAFQFSGTGTDDATVQDPAPGNRYTAPGNSWLIASIPNGVRIIRKAAFTTEFEIPFSELGIPLLGEFNIIVYASKSATDGSNFAQWPTGNSNGNNPILQAFFTFTRISGQSQNAATHYSYREHNTARYTFLIDTVGSLFLVPGSATTFTSGSLTTLGYHLYIGPNATFSLGGNTTPLSVSGNVTNDGVLALSTATGGDLMVGGKFSSNGELSCNGRTITLNGSAAQTMSGNALTFGGLSINNPAGVTLNAACTINGILTFVSGNLLIGDNKLSLGRNVDAAASCSCIVTNGTGTVEHSIPAGGSFQFPVAPTISSYNPLTISLEAHDPIETFNVRVQPTLNPPTWDTSQFVRRTWNIDELTPGGNNVQLRFQWRRNEEGSSFGSPLMTSLFGYDAGPGRYLCLSDLWTTGSDPYMSATFLPIPLPQITTWTIGPSPPLTPIQITSFTGTVLNNSRVRLSWETTFEINNSGFEIQRTDTSQRYQTIPNSFVPGHGTTYEVQHYTWTDSTANPGVWYYRLKQIELDGFFQYTDGILVNLLTHVNEMALPMMFSLSQNYPNPWNPSTTIRYALPRTAFVTLTVLNMLGQQVSQPVSEQQSAGSHDVVLRGDGLASGVYFYRLQAGEYAATKKFVLLR